TLSIGNAPAILRLLRLRLPIPPHRIDGRAMIELVDTLPDINVAPAEFKRLLGFPREKVLRDRSRELADWARAWYARNGHPWVYARQCERLEIVNETILIDGITFHSPRLLKMFHEAQADSAILVALSAGREIETAALDAW